MFGSLQSRMAKSLTNNIVLATNVVSEQYCGAIIRINKISIACLFSELIKASAARRGAAPSQRVLPTLELYVTCITKIIIKRSLHTIHRDECVQEHGAV